MLSKKLNTKIKNELEYLRKRNAELEKEVTEQYNELSKYKQDSANIRAELEAEYKEREKNLYKRPISELVGLLNQEYFIQSRFVGVIKELSLRDKKIRCFVDFREKEYDHEPYISSEYLNLDIIIKTKEDLKKVYAAIDKADTDTDSKNQRYYNIYGFLSAYKELANEIVDYLNKEGYNIV